MQWIKQKRNVILFFVEFLVFCALLWEAMQSIYFMSNWVGREGWSWIDSIGFFISILSIITFIVRILMLMTSKAASCLPTLLVFEDFFHFFYIFILLMFINLLSGYDHAARVLLKTDKCAQENTETFKTVLSFFEDFIWISALIVVIEVVVVILAARSLITDGNSHWFVRTNFYLVFGFIFTALAYLMVRTFRPLKQLAEIPVGHKTLWWLITGCLAVLIYTYSKQIFDERICPKDEKTAPKKIN